MRRTTLAFRLPLSPLGDHMSVDDAIRATALYGTLLGLGTARYVWTQHTTKRNRRRNWVYLCNVGLTYALALALALAVTSWPVHKVAVLQVFVLGMAAPWHCLLLR